MLGDVTNVIRNDSKLFGKRCLRFSALKPAKNFFSLLDAKSPRPHASLSSSVLHIVPSRAEKQMIWSDTITDITPVENTLSRGNYPEVQLPRKAMGGSYLSVPEVMDSVPGVVQFPTPEPARVSLADVSPKRRDRINGPLVTNKKPSVIIAPTRRKDTVTPALTQSHRNYFRIGSFRSLSQYGEWHFGHTFGLSGRFGHQRCSQRLHRACRMVFSIDRSILLPSPLVNSQLVAG